MVKEKASVFATLNRWFANTLDYHLAPKKEICYVLLKISLIPNLPLEEIEKSPCHRELPEEMSSTTTQIVPHCFLSPDTKILRRQEQLLIK